MKKIILLLVVALFMCNIKSFGKEFSKETLIELTKTIREPTDKQIKQFKVNENDTEVELLKKLIATRKRIRTFSARNEYDSQGYEDWGRVYIDIVNMAYDRFPDNSFFRFWYAQRNVKGFDWFSFMRLSQSEEYIDEINYYIYRRFSSLFNLIMLSTTVFEILQLTGRNDYNPYQHCKFLSTEVESHRILI